MEWADTLSEFAASGDRGSLSCTGVTSPSPSATLASNEDARSRCVFAAAASAWLSSDGDVPILFDQTLDVMTEWRI